MASDYKDHEYYELLERSLEHFPDFLNHLKRGDRLESYLNFHTKQAIEAYNDAMEDDEDDRAAKEIAMETLLSNLKEMELEQSNNPDFSDAAIESADLDNIAGMQAYLKWKYGDSNEPPKSPPN